ncbi:unnamed protein product [Orchesella dallaii]|uniref:Uncharacterized protein n=1 Tax=Orchesella dallaii TaxID=48710 RepID=A0ABP1QZ59_9HEXA
MYITNDDIPKCIVQSDSKSYGLDLALVIFAFAVSGFAMTVKTMYVGKMPIAIISLSNGGGS